MLRSTPYCRYSCLTSPSSLTGSHSVEPFRPVFLMQTVTLEQQLTRLRRDYLATLPGHARVMMEASRMLTHVRWDDSTLEQLQKEAHLLAGSGGTFGFDRLTQVGRELARIAEEQLQTTGKVTLASRTRLEHACEAMLAEIETVLKVRKREKPLPREAGIGARLAILDEDPIQGQHLKLWCEAWGYEVSWFSSLSLLLEDAREHSYALLLVDPLGFASVTPLLQEIEASLAMPAPVLLLSARTDITSRLEALRAGASGYLTRPLDNDVLRAEISRLLASNRLTRPKVLLVDNHKAQAEMYKASLDQQGFDSRVLHKPMMILDVMARFNPDILLVNSHMNELNGPELARLLHQDSRYLQVPIVFIANSAEVVHDEPSITLAGDDFLIKPVTDRLLMDTLHRRLARARHLSHSLKLINGSQEEGGLQNRGRFFQQLETDLAANRSSTQSGKEKDILLYLAADKPELLRNQYGVMGCAGLGNQIDHWLAAHPSIGRRGCALSDLVWLVKIAFQPGLTAAATAEQFREQLSHTPFSLAGSSQTLNFSAGSVALSSDLPDAEHVLQGLETACADATMAGGGRVTMASLNGNKARPPLAERLQKALKAHSFVLQYQPVVNLDTNQNHFQALLRLKDAQGNLYLPEEFMANVPDYLKDGLAGMDRWVIEAAVSALDGVQGAEAEACSVIIKLSSSVNTLMEMVPFITNVMQNARLREDRRLYFAFQEQFILKNLEAVRPLLETLSRLNAGIIIENFAASTKGFLLLDELPLIDYVRLDANWNQRVNRREEVAALLEVLHRRFGGMDRVIACRVEDAKTFSAFWDMGIRHFQGYFVQQPGNSMLLE
ncbi:MAG: EAL domain-containing protein [Halomonadaceae bacterium]|nr:MAG: EAL domain-containing protein [Halomonadaceae bacterium]